ncbi:glycosyltransferase family A protein [Streptosporangium sp. NPDC002524]|uniref:glycosyltransferase family A protein n=1 Tax=Streptosporangium sp. NPDC002524 TaxID=3154537 RepID=UPI00331A3390
MSEVPPNVTGLAERRAKARAEHDHAASDALRDEIRTEGWLVRDTADGFELIPSPSFEVWPTVGSLPEGGSPGTKRDGSDGDPDREPGASTAPGRVSAEDADDRDTDAATGRDDSADPGRVAEAAEPGRHPERLGDLDAKKVAESEAAPQQRPEGSELVGRADDLDGRPERMVSSQLLWDASLSVSRLDETIVPPAEVEEERAARSTVTVALLVDGRPDEVRECVRALVARTEARVLALDLGDVDGAGAVLQELVEEFPRRVEAWHVAEAPHWKGGSAGWGESRDKLLRLDTSDVHVVMDTSVILDGDAVTPLVKALDDDVTAAGWKGVNPREDDEEWLEAEPGEVRGLLGHLFAVRRDTALDAGGFPAEARYYRNADLEFSLRLPGTLVALGKDLPVHQDRHRRDDGVDPGYRDEESRRTYDRVLGLLRSP